MGDHRADGAREFGDDAVALGVEYTAVEIGDQLVDDLALLLESPQRPFLVDAHELRVAHDIGG